jgi:putative intracellular protease/amidase
VYGAAHEPSQRNPTVTVQRLRGLVSDHEGRMITPLSGRRMRANVPATSSREATADAARAWPDLPAVIAGTDHSVTSRRTWLPARIIPSRRVSVTKWLRARSSIRIDRHAERGKVTSLTEGPGMKNVLMIVTSHDRLGATQEKTGFWLEELAAPYQEFSKAGLSVDIASPRGGKPPADPRSEADATSAVHAFMEDTSARAKLERSVSLANVSAKYDAYFVVGGHGVMWDLADDPNVSSLLAREYDDGKVVAAVCHGPAALVNVRLSGGSYLVAGKRVTGFSNAEEEVVGLSKVVPFALETTLVERGGKYESGPLWQPFAVADGRLVTGQNPGSSALTALKVLATLGF